MYLKSLEQGSESPHSVDCRVFGFPVLSLGVAKESALYLLTQRMAGTKRKKKKN